MDWRPTKRRIQTVLKVFPPFYDFSFYDEMVVPFQTKRWFYGGPWLWLSLTLSTFILGPRWLGMTTMALWLVLDALLTGCSTGYHVPHLVCQKRVYPKPPWLIRIFPTRIGVSWITDYLMLHIYILILSYTQFEKTHQKNTMAVTLNSGLSYEQICDCHGTSPRWAGVGIQLVSSKAFHLVIKPGFWIVTIC